MTDEQFNAEKEYQIRMSIMRKLLKEQVITDQEYKKIDTKLLKKYQPVFGVLCRWNGLIMRSIRGNMLTSLINFGGKNNAKEKSYVIL